MIQAGREATDVDISSIHGAGTDKQFTGHQREHELIFMQSRFYDPAIGRFLQPDSKACPERSRRMPDPANPQSLNRYSYVLNNPLVYTDPTGETPCPQVGADLPCPGDNILGQCLLGMYCAPGSSIPWEWTATPVCHQYATCLPNQSAFGGVLDSEAAAFVIDSIVEATVVGGIGCGIHTAAIGTSCAGSEVSGPWRWLSLAPGDRWLRGGVRALRFADDAADVASVVPIHGNSLDSPVTAYLYRLLTKEGEYLKTGVSGNLAVRYTKAYMEDKRFQILQSGTRRDMLALERKIIERNPGPLNREPWAGLLVDKD